MDAILFDLDGTLLDTLADIANSMNAALEQYGFPAHPVEKYRYYVGDGTEMLVKRTIPKEYLSEQMIAKCLRAVKEQYSKRWADNTKPYPGIAELLTELDKQKIPKAILSNKPDNFTKLTVGKLLGDWSFDVVRGLESPIRKKPDPASAFEIANEMRISPSNFLYLGDTDTDMQTAVAAGMYPVGVLWGFRTAQELRKNGAKILIERPIEVMDILKNSD